MSFLYTTTTFSAQSNRQGVALVLVLGFLAILTLMAVTFAITLRTERLVSRSHLNHVQADALLDVALSRAMAEITQRVDSDPFPRQRVYTPAQGVDATIFEFNDAFLNRLPGVFEFRHAADLTGTTQRWIPFHDPSGVLTGRVSFLIADCSGFLDADVIRQQPRRSGLLPGEIQPILEDDEADFQDSANADLFFTTLRDTMVRLFGQAELSRFFEQHAGHPTRSTPHFLFPFSYAPPDLRTIPVVLDQNNDGNLRYIDADGRPALRENIDGPAGIPNWMRAFSDLNTVELPNEQGADEEFSRRVDRHWEEMLSETSLHDHSPVNGHPFPQIMSDYFAQYNRAKGSIRADLDSAQDRARLANVVPLTRRMNELSHIQWTPPWSELV